MVYCYMRQIQSSVFIESQSVYYTEHNTVLITQSRVQLIDRQSANYTSHNTVLIPQPRIQLIDSQSANYTEHNPVLITLFTTWTNAPQLHLCHNNTVRNWNQLKPSVRSILFTNDTEVSEDVSHRNWSVLPVQVKASGLPVLKNMYIDAIKHSPSPFYAYANGDLLFTEGLRDTLVAVQKSDVFDKTRYLLIVGTRTNVKDVTSHESRDTMSISNLSKTRGLFTPELFEGIDYFITNGTYPWSTIPEIVIAREGYDNWLLHNSRNEDHVTIDATKTLLALHQSTDYNRPGSSSNFNYNRDLLFKLFKQTHYMGGICTCTDFITDYNHRHEIIVKRRDNKPKFCNRGMRNK